VHPELPDKLAGLLPVADLPGLDALFENAPYLMEPPI
jgi:hypothetical protein